MEAVLKQPETGTYLKSTVTCCARPARYLCATGARPGRHLALGSEAQNIRDAHDARADRRRGWFICQVLNSLAYRALLQRLQDQGVNVT